MCYLEAFKFTTEAKSWGLKKESALEEFEGKLNHLNEHPGFTTTLYYSQEQFKSSFSFLGIALLFFGLYCVDLVYVTVPYGADLLSASIPKAKKIFVEVIMPEVLGEYFYLKSTMRTEVPPKSLLNQYLRCYCQKESPGSKKNRVLCGRKLQEEEISRILHKIATECTEKDYQALEM
ncbi:hypothetical protein DAPPUDRAFT_332523 [Daphnia pulex]|uniref:Uncharacterized protein n=1 Tax=Daphnia pulex TaxID=6669 RepID=E9HQ69_DAPPU|nr:hypothetical protein DAPPUDRAFT_332523 [Daphnia pulex]|eukprot:EFX66120.1 hypothetical protein DAPPUDRAFT_332523 [Daphnia pulex]